VRLPACGLWPGLPVAEPCPSTTGDA
jgi:hypothetical protein